MEKEGSYWRSSACSSSCLNPWYDGKRGIRYTSYNNPHAEKCLNPWYDGKRGIRTGIILLAIVAV